MRRILTFGGLGGLICGIDFGIIAVAVPYIRSLRLYSDTQIGWIVGGVLFGGILAIIGVVAAPITSGDTAFRSARLIVADFLRLEQKGRNQERT